MDCDTSFPGNQRQLKLLSLLLFPCIHSSSICQILLKLLNLTFVNKNIDIYPSFFSYMPYSSMMSSSSPSLGGIDASGLEIPVSADTFSCRRRLLAAPVRFLLPQSLIPGTKKGRGFLPSLMLIVQTAIRFIVSLKVNSGVCYKSTSKFSS